jgi:hypothetical protein
LEANLLFGRLTVSGVRLRCSFYCLALAGAALLPTVAQAQSVWGGTGSVTPTTTDYNLGTNWRTNPAAPVAGGQSAQFANTGNATVVTTGAITPELSGMRGEMYGVVDALIAVGPGQSRRGGVAATAHDGSERDCKGFPQTHYQDGSLGVA